MPIVTVSMYSGRTQREKDRLAETITEDVVKVLNVDKKEVVILFQEASHGNWYVSGVRIRVTRFNGSLVNTRHLC